MLAPSSTRPEGTHNTVTTSPTPTRPRPSSRPPTAPATPGTDLAIRSAAELTTISSAAVSRPDHFRRASYAAALTAALALSIDVLAWWGLRPDPSGPAATAMLIVAAAAAPLLMAAAVPPPAEGPTR